MPTFDGVYVPDELISSPVASSERPGLGDIIGAAAQGAYGALRYGLPYQYKKLANELEPGDEEFYQKGLQQSAAAASRAAPASLEDIGTGRVGLGGFIAENLAASLPYMVTGIVGAGAGFAAGGPVGAGAGFIAGATPQFSGTNVARAVEEQGGLSDAAAERSLLVAPLQSAADLAVGRFLPGAGKFLGSAAATQTGKGFLSRTVQSMGKAGLTEAATEATQQLGERYAAGIPVGDADAAAEYVRAAVTGFAVGGALGAGGGFRSSEAVAKPAEMVTPQDLDAHNEAVLSGAARAAPAIELTEADTLDRAQGDFGFQGSAEQQLMFPDTAPGEPEAPASQLPQLPLDPPLSRLPAGAQLDIFGDRRRDDTQPVDLQNPVSPELEAQLAAIAGPQRTPLQASTSRLATGTPATGVPTITLPEGASRPFANDSIEEVEKAARSTADNNITRAARQELQFRREEATGQRNLTGQFKTRLSELKRGLRGGFVQSVTAKDPRELAEKVYDQVFVEADTRANTAKFAQRIGILDENLQPGPLAQEIKAAREAAKAPAATAPKPAAQQASSLATQPANPPASIEPQTTDPAQFEKEWKATLKRAGVQRLRSGKEMVAPASRAEAETQVVQLLATDQSNAQTSQIEKVAQELGLITKDDARDITPAGRAAWLRSGDGQVERVAAAGRQGFTGEQASQFERGVRDVISGVTATDIAEPSELAAYQAGQVWAGDFLNNGDVITAAQTEKVRARQQKRVTGRERDRDVKRAQLTPLQVQQQSLRRLVEALDLSRASDVDRAALSRMIDQGAGPQQVTDAIQKLQRGETLFTEAERGDYVAPRADPRRGGQPVYQELRGRDRDDILRITGQVPSKAAMRAETERARIAADLESLIEFAEIEEAITPRRAAALRKKLDDGKIDEVARLLKDFDPDYIPPAPQKAKVAKIKNPVEVQSAVVHDQLTGREKAVVARHYGQKTYNKTAKARFVNDVAKAINEGLDKVAEALRVIIKRIEAGVLAAAMVFNPMALQTPQGAFDVEVTTVQAQAATVPQSAGMSSIAELAYKRLAPVAQQRGSGFMIVDKANSKLHMFRADGSHIASDTVLTGATQEDSYSAEREAVKSIEELVALGERVTPAGTFTTRVFKQGNAKGKPLGLMLVDKNGKSNFVAIHTTVIDSRLQQLDTSQTTDNAVTLGCVSVDPDFYAKSIAPDIQSLADNLVFVLPYDEKQLDQLLPDAAEIDIEIPPLGQELPDLEPGLTGTDRRTSDARKRGKGRGRQRIPTMDAADVQPAQTVQSMNDATKQFASRAKDAAERVFTNDRAAAIRRWGMGWLSHNQMERAYGEQVPGVGLHRQAHQTRVAARGRVEQLGDEVMQRYEALERSNPKAAKRVPQLMAMTTEFQVDHEKTWEEHEHLVDDPNAADLERIHKEAVKLANDMKRGDGEAMTIFRELRALNEAQNYMRMSTMLHDHIATDQELQLGVEDSRINPFDTFMREEGLVSPEQVRARWERLLNDQVAAVKEFVTAKKGEAQAEGESAVTAMRTHLSPVEHQIAAIYQARARMATSPYFHLGRFGKYFGSAKIAARDGVSDPASRRAVSKALEEAGFDNIQMSADNTKPNFMIRFETVDQMQRFRDVMVQLERDGHLDEGSIKAGPRTASENYGAIDGLPDYVQRYIQSIEASPQYSPRDDASPEEIAALEKQKATAVQMAVDTWLEMLPDTSVSKVLAKRYTVPGYDPDMMRSFAHRWRVGAIAIANAASRPKFNEAYVSMRTQVEQAKAVDANAETQADPVLPSDIMNELRRRDATSPMDDTADTFDKLRALSHSYFLGFSPAYGLINMTQLGVTAIPELAKKHGYAKSFAAMRRASGISMKILKAAAIEAQRLGPKNYADVTLTEKVLKNAGLNASERKFALHMLATGTIDIGSAARALAQLSENRGQSKLDTYLKYASSVGLYTEMFTRLTTAFSARDLHGAAKEGVEDYATQVVSDTMFDYQSWNTARQLGKRGFLGPVTPIVTQFMSYTVQVTEKLYSEAANIIRTQRPGESDADFKQRRKEGMTWMFGHLTAVGALAGTMGLPFATVVMTVIERLVDAFDDDDEPFSASAAYRNFLADTFGKDVGEVLARGVPRALGFDISQRAGEQDLLPFSQFLADDRSFKDAAEANLARSVGAAPSMVMSIIEGAGKFGDGDFLGGLEATVPLAFKNPIKAYRMTEEGYVDTKGTKLPMSPTASSYMWQLIGFSPAAKAEYSEARRDQQSRRGTLQRQAGELRNQILDAMLEGDQDAARELLSEAQSFDRDNPTFAVIPSLAGSLRRRMETRARAQALGTPLGVGVGDVSGQNLTSYANF